MKARGSNREQSERTRGQILEAARRLFARHGFASTSTQEIARAIGMTPGVLYWHFRSKEEILLAVIADLQQRLLAELVATSLRAAGAAPRDVLEALLDRLNEIIAARHDDLIFVQVMTAEATDHYPRVEKVLRDVYRPFSDAIAALLAQTGLWRTAETQIAARLFIGAYMGGLLQQRLFRRDMPLDTSLALLQRMALAMLLPHAPAKAARR